MRPSILVPFKKALRTRRMPRRPPRPHRPRRSSSRPMTATARTTTPTQLVAVLSQGDAACSTMAASARLDAPLVSGWLREQIGAAG